MPQRPIDQKNKHNENDSDVPDDATKKKRDGTCDQVHRYEHRTEGSQFREHVIDLIVGVRHLDRDLGEIVGVRAREDCLIMVQVLGHGDQVVLSYINISG